MSSLSLPLPHVPLPSRRLAPSPASFSHFISISFLSSLDLSLSLSLPLSTTHTLLSFSLSMTFLSSTLSFFLPPSHPSDSPEHLHCNTLTVSHTPRGGVQLVHYVSWVFLRLMENTQNASAVHHSTGKGETLSPHIASVRESFYQQAAAARSFSGGQWALFKFIFSFCSEGLSHTLCSRLPWRNHSYTDFKISVEKWVGILYAGALKQMRSLYITCT